MLNFTHFSKISHPQFVSIRILASSPHLHYSPVFRKFPHLLYFALLGCNHPLFDNITHQTKIGDLAVCVRDIFKWGIQLIQRIPSIDGYFLINVSQNDKYSIHMCSCSCRGDLASFECVIVIRLSQQEVAAREGARALALYKIEKETTYRFVLSLVCK